MVIVKIEHLDLQQIADSGQCFRWYRLGENKYKICNSRKEVVVEQSGNIFTFDCTDEEYGDVWYKYLDLETDYTGIDLIGLAYEDKFLTEAIKYGKGIRILRQSLWETMLSFVISQNNNIPKIKGSLERIINLNDGVFPTSDDIWVIQDLLHEAGVGYRAPYIVNCADAYTKWVSDSNSDYSAIKFNSLMSETSRYSEFMVLLQSVKGIGEKVANCICLFGLHCMEACPIDVWMKRVIVDEYGGSFPEWVKSPYAGYFQQLCFYYKRNL